MSDELRALAEAATPGPWEVYSTIDAEDFVVEAGRGLFRTVATPARRVDYGRTNAAFIAAADPAAVLALLDEVDRLRADIAAAEQRGREDNADHGMCYVSGSKALEAILDRAEAAEDERDRLADGWDASIEREKTLEDEVNALRATVARVRALADEWVERDCEWSCESEMLDDLHVALDGPA